ncbi:MAG: hypothetical protein EG822_00105 [Deltaproteobacteria bacterium]|nr:hypothetical protein [Deltaproteobacteria bacterium]TLN01915.1 MAG: hypothetical protein FDZ73_14020 [bacterium]
MKKLLLLTIITLLLGGCVVYPGYYSSGYYSRPYGYYGPSVNLHYGFYGGRSHHGGFGHHQQGHGGWHR